MNHKSACSCSHHTAESRLTEDQWYERAVAQVKEAGEVSIHDIMQRNFIGYGMAKRLLERMGKDGIAVHPGPGGSWQLAPGNGTLLTDRELQREYLAALPAMMENQEVWNTVAARHDTPEKRDAFLFDRFKVACGAYNIGMRFNEWHDLAATCGIEPPLAQYVWDLHNRPF
jgi:L-amino acid N-acyltransferase YncA